MLPSLNNALQAARAPTISLPAILGGKPVFKKPYHLVRPDLPSAREVMEGYKNLYRTRMLSNQGVYVRTLEKRIAHELSVKHCALFCNGTIAILCLLNALDIRGDVLVPSFSFAATAHALVWQGLRPRFVDIHKDALTMDHKSAEKQITTETAAIFPVNIFGNFCHHDKLASLADRFSVPLIYDSAQSFGTKYRGILSGSLGAAEVFSFHATKLFHTLEGGAITTGDTALYLKLCKIRNFGFSSYLNCGELGINGKMNELSALIGHKLLDRFSINIKKRKNIVKKYFRFLKDIPGLKLPRPPNYSEPNYSYMHISVLPEDFGLSNLELNYALMADHIITRCYFYPPIHRTKFYCGLLGDATPCLPETDWAATHSLCLPLHSEMSDSDINRIVEGIDRCHKHAAKIKSFLSGKIPIHWHQQANMQFMDPYDIFILKKRRS